MTIYHYDETSGRLAWSETLADAEWRDEDLEDVLDWKADRDGRCSGCGEPLSESTDPELATAWLAEGVDCFACQAVDRASTPGARGRRFRIINRARN